MTSTENEKTPATPTASESRRPNVCERCQLPADELHQVTSASGVVGPRLCPTCVSRAEREARENSPAEIARKAQIDREMEEFRARQRIDSLRPPRAEHECEISRHHGRAEILRGGVLMCRACAEKTGPTPGETYSPPFAEAPVIVLEKRVAALEAAVAALGQPAAKASRKAGAQ